jgi:hypothetical protein
VESVDGGSKPAEAVAPPFEVIEHPKTDLTAALRGDVTNRAGQARAGDRVDIDDIGERDDPCMLDQPVDASDPPARRADDLWRRGFVEPVQPMQPGSRLEGGDESSAARVGRQPQL